MLPADASAGITAAPATAIRNYDTTNGLRIAPPPLRHGQCRGRLDLRQENRPWCSAAWTRLDVTERDAEREHPPTRAGFFETARGAPCSHDRRVLLRARLARRAAARRAGA